MFSKRIIEIAVGLFILAGIAAFAFLSLSVSGLVFRSPVGAYTLTAKFQDIGNLKPRGSVAVAGVAIGAVTKIVFDPKDFTAVVTMRIDGNASDIPVDSAAKIKTKGLLGDNYISIDPGFDTQVFKDGDVIHNTYKAVILEDLISQFMGKTVLKD